MTSSFQALQDQPSLVAAWKQAANFLHDVKGRACYNLIYTVTEPSVLSSSDLRVIGEFDDFALAAGIGRAETVANTIFPLDTYLRYGRDEFFDVFDRDIYPRVKRGWGNYFHRLTTRLTSDGTPATVAGKKLNPLSSLVEKLERKGLSGNGSKGHYELVGEDEALELTTYLPEKDRNFHRGGPCLSHVSLKIDGNKAVRLTGFYRSHFYIERALGNLLGLARLQTFIANEAGFKVGPMTCIASQATLERAVGQSTGAEVEAMLKTVGVT